MICFNLINVSTSREKLRKNLSKLESKLKTKVVDKKDLQIKKEKLENKVIELVKYGGNETIPSLIQEKEYEIQNIKKNLKIPHDSHVKTIELEKVIQEKRNLKMNSKTPNP